MASLSVLNIVVVLIFDEFHWDVCYQSQRKSMVSSYWCKVKQKSQLGAKETESHMPLQHNGYHLKIKMSALD